MFSNCDSRACGDVDIESRSPCTRLLTLKGTISDQLPVQTAISAMLFQSLAEITILLGFAAEEGVTW